MLNKRHTIDIIKIFKNIRSIYDIVFISIGGSLWIFSTLWDIYKLQRYWLDYSIEFYSSFLIFFMMIYSINPKAVPVAIYNSFKLITTIRGRGIMLIIISSLFLKDKHTFHKFCAVILFIGGILYIICEILVPTTKEELKEIDSIYNGNDKNDVQSRNTNNAIFNSQIHRKKEMNVNNKQSNNDNSNTNNNNNIVNETVGGLIKENDEKDTKNNRGIDKDNTEKNENNEKDNKNNESGANNNIFSEIIRKTDNPYEIPEDF